MRPTSTFRNSVDSSSNLINPWSDEGKRQNLHKNLGTYQPISVETNCSSSLNEYSFVTAIQTGESIAEGIPFLTSLNHIRNCTLVSSNRMQERLGSKTVKVAYMIISILAIILMLMARTHTLVLDDTKSHFPSGYIPPIMTNPRFEKENQQIAFQPKRTSFHSNTITPLYPITLSAKTVAKKGAINKPVPPDVQEPPKNRHPSPSPRKPNPTPAPLPSPHPFPSPGDDNDDNPRKKRPLNPPSDSPVPPPVHDIRPKYNILLRPTVRLMFVPPFAFIIIWLLFNTALWGAAAHAQQHEDLTQAHLGRSSGVANGEWQGGGETEALLGETRSSRANGGRDSGGRRDLTKKHEAEASVSELVQQVQSGAESSRDIGSNRPIGSMEMPPYYEIERPFMPSDQFGTFTGENLLGEAVPPGSYPEEQLDTVMAIKNAGQVAAMMATVSMTLALSGTLAGIALPPPTARKDVVGSPTRILALLISSWAAFAVGLVWIFAEASFKSLYDTRKMRFLATATLFSLVLVHGVALERENRARIRFLWNEPPPSLGPNIWK